jgi:AcrR family transcriptional regulator
MSPRPNVSEQRKLQILQAAEEVFTEKGFDDARMDDIAQQTGLSKGTLYLYFKSKDEVILAILDRMFRLEFRHLERQNLGDGTATAAIGRMTDLVAKDMASFLTVAPIIYSFLALAFRNRYVKRALKEYINRFVDLLRPVIQRGIVSGEFRKVDAQEVAIAAGAVIEGTLLLWVYDHEVVDPARHIQSGMKLLMEGVQAR